MSSAELYINLTNICSNWSALNSLSNGSAGAVVKANAYGLGIKEVGISLAKAGARDFFVAIAEEERNSDAQLVKVQKSMFFQAIWLETLL